MIMYQPFQSETRGHSVQDIWTPLCMAAVCRQPPLYGHPTPFIYFSEPPTFDKNIFAYDAPTIYVINTKINSPRKVSSSWLEDYNTSFHVFYKQNFYNQHQIEIWTKTTISSLPPPSTENFPPLFFPTPPVLWTPFLREVTKTQSSRAFSLVETFPLVETFVLECLQINW